MVIGIYNTNENYRVTSQTERMLNVIRSLSNTIATEQKYPKDIKCLY